MRVGILSVGLKLNDLQPEQIIVESTLKVKETAVKVSLST